VTVPLERSELPASGVVEEASFAEPSAALIDIVERSESTTPSKVIDELAPELLGEKYITVLLLIVDEETSTPLAERSVDEVKPSDPPVPLKTIESVAGSKPVIETLLSRATMLAPSKLTSKVNTSAADVAEYAPASN
jgi:hypothetical protein